MITGDELSFAGLTALKYGGYNNLNYLYDSSLPDYSYAWTLSPNYWIIYTYAGDTTGKVRMATSYSNSSTNSDSGVMVSALSACSTANLYPVISLNSTVTVKGTGTEADPYVVQ